MKKPLDNPEELVYINVVFKIKRQAIVKLIDFLKQNTKTFQWYWVKGESDEAE
jgi:hypothetical protein